MAAPKRSHEDCGNENHKKIKGDADNNRLKEFLSWCATSGLDLSSKVSIVFVLSTVQMWKILVKLLISLAVYCNMAGYKVPLVLHVVYCRVPTSSGTIVVLLYPTM